MSLLVALVLVPMLSAHLSSRGVPRAGSAFNRGYGRFLALTLKARWLIGPFVRLDHGRLLAANEKNPRGVLSRIRRRPRLSMALEMPPGTPLEQTERVVARLEAPLLRMRYRDPDLIPILQAYEDWGISANTPRFLKEAEARLANLARRKPNHPLLARMRAWILDNRKPARFWDVLRVPAEETIQARYPETGRENSGAVHRRAIGHCLDWRRIGQRGAGR